MVAIKTRTRTRSARGFSITELLMSTFIFAFSIAIIGELSVVSTLGTLRTTNKVDGLAQARSAANRICDDVRHATAFGDYYGRDAERLNFPSPTNPIYNGGRLPTGGYPVAPWPANIRLNESTLIIQSPVSYLDPLNDPTSASYSSGAAENPLNGMPIMLPKGNFDGVSDPPANMLNLDTTIYSVVPDTTRTGEFLLQVARFPGAAITSPAPGFQTSYKGYINPPQTILKGIIGPKAPGAVESDLPQVFSYLARTQKPGAASTFSKVAPSFSTVNDIQGVAFDVEVRNTGNSSTTSTGNLTQFIPLHDESYIRSNRNMVLENTGTAP